MVEPVRAAGPASPAVALRAQAGKRASAARAVPARVTPRNSWRRWRSAAIAAGPALPAPPAGGQTLYAPRRPGPSAGCAFPRRAMRDRPSGARIPLDTAATAISESTMIKTFAAAAAVAALMMTSGPALAHAKLL